jgi:three-Cys-motif partner protein
MDDIPDSIVDEIGPWSEVKLDIIRKYAQTYSNILSNQKYLHHVYIDAFAGLGYHKSKTTQLLVPGSPRLAVETEPPFEKYYFVDMNETKVAALGELETIRPGCVEVFEGDCNPILVDKIFPTVQYDKYMRALCLLDPYGLHLHWEPMALAGQLKTFDIFINFPVMDMNMNVLKHQPEKVDPKQAARMTAFWGDESWRDVAYSTTGNLFGWEEKEGNQKLVDAFCKRLKNVAGFSYVAEPLPMKNSTNAVVYYLLFASCNEKGKKIVNEIFDKYRD